MNLIKDELEVQMANEFHSGFITVIGRPNVGKSTFLNHVIGEKISIISDKAQTTRHNIRGVLTRENMQIVFIDTPGIHKPKHRLGNFMVDVSLQTLNDVDIILFMIDAKQGYGKGDQFIIDRLQRVSKPVFLIINKVDQIHPDELFPLIDQYKDKCEFAEIVPISAKNGNNIEHLLKLLKDYLPVGPKYYSDEETTDHSDEFRISELIREKVLHHTEEEIPHSVNVSIEHYEEKSNGIVVIHAVIITERDSQKGILIGKQGRMLKQVGKEARLDIEQFIGKKVYLDLWVKVEKDWRNKQSLLNKFGYDLRQY